MRDKLGARAASYAISFFMPALLMLLVFFCVGITPFGDKTLICSANSQWFSGLEVLCDILRGGKTMQYSFSSALGEDFFSIFSSGYCSPFWLLAALAKQTALPGVFTLVMVLKSGFAGLFANMMLLQICPSKPFAAASFAIAYAAGSALSLGFLCPQFTDAAVFLPLVGAGTALLSKKGSILCLWLGSTFFLAGSISLWPCLAAFLAVFFAWRRTIDKNKNETLSRLALLLISSAFSVGSLMIIVIPAIYSLAQNGGLINSVQSVDYSSLLDVCASLFLGAYSSGGAIPLFFCSSMTVLAMPLYFFNSKLKLTERQTAMFFLLGLIIAAAVPVIGIVLLGFSEPTGAVVGFGFLFSCIATAVAARVIETGAELSVGKIVFSWGVVVLIFIAGAAFSGGVSDAAAIFTAGFLTLFAAITLAALHGKNGVTPAFCCVLMLLICTEIALSGVFALTSAKPSLKTFQSYIAEYSADSAAAQYIEGVEGKASTAFFRTRGADSPELRALDSQSLPGSDKAKDFLSSLGIKGEYGYTSVTDYLFSVKYIISGGEIRQNALALSPATVVPESILSGGQLSENPFEAQNEIVSQMAGAQRKLFINANTQNATAVGGSLLVTESGMELVRSEESAWIELEIIAPTNGELFAYISGDAGELLYAVAGNSEVNIINGAICSLGAYNRGESVSLLLRVDSERLVLDKIFFASLDEALTEAAFTELKEKQPSYLAIDGNTIELSAAASDTELILLSIPFNKGWVAYSNGVKLQTGELFGCLLAIKPHPGTNGITLQFQSEYFTMALTVSAVFIILSTTLIITTETIRKNGERTAMRRLLASKGAMTPLPRTAPLDYYVNDTRRSAALPKDMTQPIDFVPVYTPDDPSMPSYEPTENSEYEGFELLPIPPLMEPHEIESEDK